MRNKGQRERNREISRARRQRKKAEKRLRKKQMKAEKKLNEELKIQQELLRMRRDDLIQQLRRYHV